MLNEFGVRGGDGSPAVGPGRVLALIPAYNEETQIAATIASLREQTFPPDAIFVLANNCSEDTIRNAEDAGAVVYETVDSVHTKAGVLNQALELLLPGLRDEDFMVVLDADSMLAPDFVNETRRCLHQIAGGSGGVLTVRAGVGFVGMLGANQLWAGAYLQDKVLLLQGTATMFSVRTLWEVVTAWAGGYSPGTAALTHDVRTEVNQLTLTLLHLGYE